uniref:Enhancer of polycomb homolog 1 n=1 Tax=Aotus nancymaae TaxID=37293 RepID=A0A2K5CTE4_AOTNA
MSKLSFRARALDASKPLPVFRCEDLPDLHEYASINRAVPQMPTGMEKEEEATRRPRPLVPGSRGVRGPERHKGVT